MSDSKYLYSSKKNSLWIRLEGDVRYSQSLTFDSFIDSIFRIKKIDSVVIDLTQTAYIDSTNLGLIAKIGRLLYFNCSKKAEIYTINDEITKVIDSMGFRSFFDVHDGVTGTQVEYVDVPQKGSSDDELRKVIYKSHKVLSDMNEENSQTFKAVLNAFKSKLK